VSWSGSGAADWRAPAQLCGCEQKELSFPAGGGGEERFGFGFWSKKEVDVEPSLGFEGPDSWRKSRGSEELQGHGEKKKSINCASSSFSICTGTLISSRCLVRGIEDG
jgi:hypothetical protein